MICPSCRSEITELKTLYQGDSKISACPACIAPLNPSLYPFGADAKRSVYSQGVRKMNMSAAHRRDIKSRRVWMNPQDPAGWSGVWRDSKKAFI